MLRDNPNLTGITFGASVSGAISTFYAYNCNLTGTLDLSGISAFGSSMGNIFVYNNPNLTGITIGTISSGICSSIQVHECDITGILDLSEISSWNTTACTVYAQENSKLTGISFDSGLTGTLTRINAYDCDLTGTLDISMFDANIGINIEVYNNSNLTGLSLPSGTSFTEISAYSCDLGYIDFSVIGWVRSNSKIYLQDNSMTATEVNHILEDLATLVSGEEAGGDYSGRSIDISGTNAAPDGSSGGYDGLTAKNDLEDKGITVYTN
jgi:hypothetical protein